MFRLCIHAACLRDGRAAVRHQNVAKAMASLETTIARAPVEVTRRLRRATKTGAWIMVQPSTVIPISYTVLDSAGVKSPGGVVSGAVLPLDPSGWAFFLVTAQPWYMRGALRT